MLHAGVHFCFFFVISPVSQVFIKYWIRRNVNGALCNKQQYIYFFIAKSIRFFFFLGGVSCRKNLYFDFLLLLFESLSLSEILQFSMCWCVFVCIEFTLVILISPLLLYRFMVKIKENYTWKLVFFFSIPSCCHSIITDIKIHAIDKNFVLW